MPVNGFRKEDFMKNKDEDIEEMLLNHASLDDLIKMKIEAEFKDEMKKAKRFLKDARLTYWADFLRAILGWTMLSKKSKLF